MAEKNQQFVVLPARGLRVSTRTPDPTVGLFLKSLDSRIGVKSMAAAPMPGANIRVIDSISEDGAKLVEMKPSDIQRLKLEQPGLRVVPLRHYELARAPIPHPIPQPKKLGLGVTARLSLKIVSQTNNAPVRNALVVAFTNFALRRGAEGKTNAQGVVSLDLGSGSSKRLDMLFVLPEVGFWSQVKSNITVRNNDVIKVPPIDLSFVDCVRHFYPNSPLTAGAGVTVGVLDTGVGPHPDLVVAGGANCVTGQNPADFTDNGDLHGTHVAGIIASRGTAPTGIRGIAAGVTLRSYRVFPKGSGASNFDIAKAIDAAVADGCDLINMSLGGGSTDEAIQSAIVDARAAGVAAIIAAGNDHRSPVSFPARESLAIAVSALGRKGTLPAGTKELATDVKAPFGADNKNFIAEFSNIGNEIDVTGPGVGVISTVVGGHGVMSGTSMACPAVTGAAARLLATKADILAMARNEARSDRIVHEILKAAKTLGFAANFQGQGALI